MKKDLAALQMRLAPLVEREDRLGEVRHVAGVDVAYDAERKLAVAAAVLIDPQTMTLEETAIASEPLSGDYEPGQFAQRELSPTLAALRGLSIAPDLIICDGHGVAHPRRCGLASQLGLELDLPVIGCAKTRLVGKPVEPRPMRGERAALIHEGEALGAALRTQDEVKPVYVSTGHRISLETACDWVLRLAPRYRLPETTRAADRACRAALAGISGGG